MFSANVKGPRDGPNSNQLLRTGEEDAAGGGARDSRRSRSARSELLTNGKEATAADGAAPQGRGKDPGRGRGGRPGVAHAGARQRAFELGCRLSFVTFRHSLTGPATSCQFVNGSGRISGLRRGRDHEQPARGRRDEVDDTAGRQCPRVPGSSSRRRGPRSRAGSAPLEGSSGYRSVPCEPATTIRMCAHDVRIAWCHPRALRHAILVNPVCKQGFTSARVLRGQLR